MDPKDNEALKNIKQNLEKKLNKINPSINLDDIYSDDANPNVDINNPINRIEEQGNNQNAGYRYDSSSNLRRKSRTRSNSKKSNSSASASSQNKAKKDKKNKKTKKILGGGKRNRKTKSKRGAKRKN